MKNRLLSFLLISTMFSACVIFSRFQPGGKEYEKVKESNSTNEAREQFNSYPVDKQIDIYLFGLKYVEPDDNSSQKFLLVDGDRKLPTIIQRIRDADEEFDKAYLMEVVSLINRDCNCVSEEQKANLSEIGSSLKDTYHRARFQRALEKLNE